VKDNGSVAGSGEHHKKRTFESQLLMESVQRSKCDKLLSLCIARPEKQRNSSITWNCEELDSCDSI
jgi:hypothetical protein